MENQLCKLFALADGEATHALGKTKEILLNTINVIELNY